MKGSKVISLIIISGILLCSLFGCSTLGYYSQSIRGHLSLLAKRQPVADLLQDESLDESRHKQLALASDIRNYASKTLKLPDNGSYRQYVELDKPYIVWNVVATPELSLDPVKWCFPIVGCLTYRGYYDEQAAERYAQPLRDKGYDVMVRGVRAYSTLGWFDDPLLSTMFRQGPNALAEVIFHELSHQIIYAKNDTVFNEAFASAVGELGVKRWIKSRQPEKLDDYLQALQRRDQFLDLLRNTSDALRTLYASELDDGEKRRRKAGIISQLHEDYEKLKAGWDGFNGYDGWFKTPVNNARLISIAVYRDRVPDFMRWFDACGSDFSRFYAVVKRMGKMEQQERHGILTGPASCAADT
jgi:predicted aminopeptidase